MSQKDRLVLQHIILDDEKKPRISQITEAGLLCKSGINSSGVSVFLNAISQRGLSLQALPIHIGLRVVLEAATREDAISQITELGIATSGNMLIADKTGSNCLEFTHADLIRMETNDGLIVHTNHFVAEHCFIPQTDLPWPDTIARLQRATLLLKKCHLECTGPTNAMKCLEQILEDEDGFPTAINRCNTDESTSATLFSIVADLRNNTARIRLGRPSAPEGIWRLNPTEL